MIRVATLLFVSLTLAACGGSSGDSSGASGADIAVTNTSPSEVDAGQSVTFNIAVTNAGPQAASDVGLALHLDGAPAIGSITCAATGGATCPDSLSDTMTLATLPVGGGLIFLVTVPGSADLVGPITTSMTATAAADAEHANNTAESTTIAMDLRSGDYTVFASNGRQYTLTLDFNEKTWHMIGQQVDQSGIFTRDANGIDYVINGTARFRMGTDIVVGGLDFNLDGSLHSYDHGVRPFVGARKFTTSSATLSGKSFNMLGVNLRRNDSLEAVVLPATFAVGSMKVCLDPVPTLVANCAADQLATYALATIGQDIKGTDAVHKDVIHFRVAVSGGALIMLRAEDNSEATGREFRVGLPETNGLAGGSFAVSSTRSTWGTMTLSDTHYAMSGTNSDNTVIDETADLSALIATGPNGVRSGVLSPGGAPIYVGQSDPLAVMMGAANGAAEGTIDVGLR